MIRPPQKANGYDFAQDMHYDERKATNGQREGEQEWYIASHGIGEHSPKVVWQSTTTTLMHLSNFLNGSHNERRRKFFGQIPSRVYFGCVTLLARSTVSLGIKWENLIS